MDNETCWRCDGDEVAEYGLCVACLEETLEDRTLIAETLRQKALGVINDSLATDIFEMLARRHIPVTRYVEAILAAEGL